MSHDRQPGRLRSLARRVKGRLTGASATTGDVLGAHNDRAFALLSEEGEGAFQRVGASLVGAWEVGITDLARALEPRLETAAKNRLTERLSDGLVPTQQPLNDAKRDFGAAVRKGLQTGLQSGRLTDATAAPTAVLAALGSQVEVGWGKSAAYLAPLWETLPGDDLADRFTALGGRLRDMMDTEAQRFADAMAALPGGHDLDTEIVAATDVWYQKVSVGIELIVYDGRTLLVQAAEQLPLKD